MDSTSASPAYEEVIPYQNRYNNPIFTLAYRVYPGNNIQPHSTVTPILHPSAPYPIQNFQPGSNFLPVINQNTIYQVPTHQTIENFRANAVTQADMAVRIEDRLLISKNYRAACLKNLVFTHK